MSPFTLFAIPWFAKRAEAARAASRKIMDMIPLGQPILIGHHSERHARRDIARIDSGFKRASEELERAAANTRRAVAIESDRAISSWDPDADGRIAERIAELEARQERMKSINSTIRKAKPGTLDAAFIAIDLTDKERADLVSAARFSGSKGYPTYALSNNNGNIRRLRERLVTLERQRTSAPAGYLKAVPNKWPGKCEGCGAAVDARAGVYASDIDGNAGVQCMGCWDARA